jgi:hypothetical protein
MRAFIQSFIVELVAVRTADFHKRSVDFAKVVVYGICESSLEFVKTIMNLSFFSSSSGVFHHAKQIARFS